MLNMNKSLSLDTTNQFSSNKKQVDYDQDN